MVSKALFVIGSTAGLLFGQSNPPFIIFPVPGSSAPANSQVSHAEQVKPAVSGSISGGEVTPGALPGRLDLSDLGAPLDSDPASEAAKKAVDAAQIKLTDSCRDSRAARCFQAKRLLDEAKAAHLDAQIVVATDRRNRAAAGAEKIKTALSSGVDLSEMTAELGRLIDVCGRDKDCSALKQSVYLRLNQPSAERASVEKEARAGLSFLTEIQGHYLGVIKDHLAQLVLVSRDKAESANKYALRAAFEEVLPNGIPAKLDSGAQYYQVMNDAR